ncbi:nucleotidyltransferase family protein [Lapillicoccus jejuensis]|uniref:Polymerase nucleotidyl transferase domain-containing protein n=1 Tax=Lapillicoccus jejuensis TaxID=402171 RepID=A0A542DY66_9MICO|nr:nucleotidyltransferase domain-containing protein [Lapillicoccus jejuensis]TQJ08027.1 hypothetical protein FB458_1106 [Lapillicoccus jejuensis]
MTTDPTTSEALRARIAERRDEIEVVLRRYGATNLRLFGSVARGTATHQSDIDLMVDLSPSADNELLRVAGLTEELGDLLGTGVDVVAPTLLRETVSATAMSDAISV